MSEITIDKYVNLDERFASYDNDGYYMDPIMILIMIADNLHYGLSFSELKEFVKIVEVRINQEELDAFFKQKRRDSSTLEYFKNYLDRRKKKCATLFEIYENVENIRKGNELSKESVARFQQLDIHFNEYGYVYYEDAIRLAENIVFNIQDLYEVGDLANRLETYLDFNVTKESLDDDKNRNLDIYPREEIQLLDSKYMKDKEFLPLSKKQALEWQKKQDVKQKRK